MKIQNSSSNEITVIVEPWAEEFYIPTMKTIEISFSEYKGDIHIVQENDLIMRIFVKDSEFLGYREI